jgi:hypothetical protein
MIARRVGSATARKTSSEAVGRATSDHVRVSSKPERILCAVSPSSRFLSPTRMPPRASTPSRSASTSSTSRGSAMSSVGSRSARATATHRSHSSPGSTRCRLGPCAASSSRPTSSRPITRPCSHAASNSSPRPHSSLEASSRPSRPRRKPDQPPPGRKPHRRGGGAPSPLEPTSEAGGKSLLSPVARSLLDHPSTSKGRPKSRPLLRRSSRDEQQSLGLGRGLGAPALLKG